MLPQLVWYGMYGWNTGSKAQAQCWLELEHKKVSHCSSTSSSRYMAGTTPGTRTRHSAWLEHGVTGWFMAGKHCDCVWLLEHNGCWNTRSSHRQQWVPLLSPHSQWQWRLTTTSIHSQWPVTGLVQHDVDDVDMDSPVLLCWSCPFTTSWSWWSSCCSLSSWPSVIQQDQLAPESGRCWCWCLWLAVMLRMLISPHHAVTAPGETRAR